MRKHGGTFVAKMQDTNAKRKISNKILYHGVSVLHSPAIVEDPETIGMAK